MASREGSRKRMKMMAGSSSRPLDVTSASIASSSKQQPDSSNADTSCSTGPCSHERTLRTLNTDLDAMRQLLTCKICHNLLYEPYAAACGHTYCYQCLCQWFSNNPRKKTCPDCRVPVEQEPTPSYILREMVLVFLSRNELLPPGETADEHHKMAKEESDLIASHKANNDPTAGGLFKGMFKSRHRMVRAVRPLHDPGDNVDRCPLCHWELEDGYCNHCQRDVYDDDDLSGSYPSDEELDHDIDAEDVDAFWGVDGHDDYLGPPGVRMHHRAADSDSEDTDSEEDNLHVDDLRRSNDDEHDYTADEDGDLMGFVVGDDEVAYAGSNEGSNEGEESDVTDMPRRSRLTSRLHRRVRSPVVVSDDEAETATSAGAPVTEEEQEEDDSEDEGPFIRRPLRNKRLGRHAISSNHVHRIVISSDESSSDRSHSDDETTAREDVSNLGGFSPLYDGTDAGTSIDYDNADEAELAYTEESNQSYDDDDDDDGWDSEAGTPRHNRRSAPSTASHRLGTLGQHAPRHTSSFFDDMLGRQGSPTNAQRNRASMSGRRNRSALPIGRPSRYDAEPRSVDSMAGGARTTTTSDSRTSRSTNAAPHHPFELDNTLAAINGSYNQRVHHPMLERFLEPSQTSNSSESDSNSTVRNDRRRKRALSMDSDE